MGITTGGGGGEVARTIASFELDSCYHCPYHCRTCKIAASFALDAWISRGSPLALSRRCAAFAALSPAEVQPSFPRREAAFGEGISTAGRNARTCGAMFERAAEQLAQRRSIVLDASSARRNLRDRVFQLAAAHGAEGFPVECAPPDTMIPSRLAGRRGRGVPVRKGGSNYFRGGRRPSSAYWRFHAGAVCCRARTVRCKPWWMKCRPVRGWGFPRPCFHRSGSRPAVERRRRPAARDMAMPP